MNWYKHGELIYQADGDSNKISPDDRIATPEEIAAINLRAASPGSDYDFDDARQAWTRKRFSKLAFFGLFTMSERVAFKTQINNGNILAAVIDDSLKMAEFINVDDPATVADINTLATISGGNVLTADRAAEILGGKIYESEN